MSQIVLAAPAVAALALSDPPRPSLWRRCLKWPKELLLAVGVAYLFPLAILAVFIPIALVIKGLLLAAAWLWKTVP